MMGLTIENKYIEYTQNITIEDLEQALTVASEIAQASNIAIKCTRNNPLLATTYLGSAVILKRTASLNDTYDYLAITNRHVIGSLTNATIKVYLGNNIYIDASLLTYDVNYDLALISFNTGIMLEVATPVDETPIVGQFAIAVGSPYDIEEYYNTVTIGNISAVNRNYMMEDAYGRSVLNTFIQHDALINSGNSGGGLYEIVGINFAIPVSIVFSTFSTYLNA